MTNTFVLPSWADNNVYYLSMSLYITQEFNHLRYLPSTLFSLSFFCIPQHPNPPLLLPLRLVLLVIGLPLDLHANRQHLTPNQQLAAIKNKFPLLPETIISITCQFTPQSPSRHAITHSRRHGCTLIQNRSTRLGNLWLKVTKTISFSNSRRGKRDGHVYLRAHKNGQLE